MMQTILGANGQIAVELARALRSNGSDDVRLVSRHPRPVDPRDTLTPADLLDAAATRGAVAGSDTVYFTAGLPLDTAAWGEKFPAMLRNALDATREAGARFAYFDNTYMYPQDDRVQTEETVFAPVGFKGRVRAEMADMVLDEVARGDIPVLIGRAPEFYGPGRTQSFTNSLVLDRLRAGEKARVPVRDNRKRSLIWTPDASRALAVLGTTPDAYGQTWHLPIDENRLTYQQLVTMAADAFGREAAYTVTPAWLIRAAGVFSPAARGMRELLPRYEHDNLFDTGRFRRRFPDFPVTTFAEGFAQLAAES